MRNIQINFKPNQQVALWLARGILGCFALLAWAALSPDTDDAADGETRTQVAGKSFEADKTAAFRTAALDDVSKSTSNYLPAAVVQPSAITMTRIGRPEEDHTPASVERRSESKSATPNRHYRHEKRRLSVHRFAHRTAASINRVAKRTARGIKRIFTF